MSSVWLQPLPSPRPALVGEQHCDVLVIGAGLCGSSAALSLARQGIEVIQLEARQVAMSATGRNAGFILQGTAERYDRAVSLLGRERARRIHNWTLDNHRLIRDAVQELGIDCGYRRSGSLQLAGSEREEQELRESAALLAEDGFAARLLEGSDLPAVFRDTGHRVGVLMEEDGELDPARFVRGLAVAAEQAGCRIFERSRVTALHHVGDQILAQLEHGSVRATVVVVATNARAGELLPWFTDKVDPVRGQMLATAPLPRLFDTPVYANHGYDYWRQDEQGRVVLGGWRNLDPDAEVGHDELLNQEIQGRMLAFLERFPWGEPLQVTRRWSGIMGFSRDGLPLVGPAPDLPQVLAGVGFTGHGFGFAMLAGSALASQVLEGTHPFCEDMDPRRMA